MTGRRLVAAAAVIATLTVVTRLVGFARTLTFAGAVGTTDLGDIYQTANTIPNLIFEVVAGGALAIVVVPLLAGHVAAGDARHVAQISSALLTWTVVTLVPVALAVALFAEPIVGLLVGAGDSGEAAVGARMLRVFALQLPLYGAGVVLTGVLHAHHRFVAAVLAPLLSSLVVIGAYVTFAAVDGAGTTIAQVSPAGELVLSIGTTLGVVVLAGCLIIPVRSLRLSLRPVFGLDSGVRRRAIGLAGAGVVLVAAQQVAIAGFIRLANAGPDGTLVLFTLAQAVFLVPWAVLAVPLSTPTFPVLAEAATDPARFDATLARTARAMLLVAGLGVAGLVAMAAPLGRVLSMVTATHPSPRTLSAAILAFAPGLFGFALFTLLHRALNAAGDAGRAATAAALGWAVTLLAGWGLTAAGEGTAWVGAAWVGAAAGDGRVVVLAAANSIGMSVLGAATLVALVRRRGVRAVSGLVPALFVGLIGAAFGGMVGWGMAELVTGITLLASLLSTIVAGFAACAVYAATAALLDRGEVRPALRRIMARAGLVVQR